MKKKISVLLTAIAAMSGMGGAVYGHNRTQMQNHYRLTGGNYVLITNFDPDNCLPLEDTTCSYLITSEAPVIPQSSNPDTTPDFEGVYVD